MRINQLKRTLAAAVLVAAGCAEAAAQSAAGSRASIAASVGIGVERAEDNLRGSSRAVGVAAVLPLHDAWGLEVDLWYPGFIQVNDQHRHRDILVGGSVRRTFGRGVVRPHVLAGLAFALTQERLTLCLAPATPVGGQLVVSCSEPNVASRVVERVTTTSVVPAGGVGVTAATRSRLQIVGDVRVHPSITSFVVRASVGVAYQF